MNIALSRQVEQGAVRLNIAGEVDHATSDLVAATIRCALSDGQPSVLIIDLDRVRVVDTVGIAMLIQAHRAAARQHTVLRVMKAHGMVEQALRDAESPGPSGRIDGFRPVQAVVILIARMARSSCSG